VASGIGLTVLPRASVPDMGVKDGMLQFRHFDQPEPSRRVVMVWRKSFTRKAAIDAICSAVAQCELPGVTPLCQDEPSA
jgi:LysR family transcriptional regulator, hydrogen peroxide-inducible genes activator